MHTPPPSLRACLPLRPSRPRNSNPLTRILDPHPPKPQLADVRQAGLGMEAFLRNFSCTHLKSPLAGAAPCPAPGVDELLASLTEAASVDLEGMAASYALHASGVLAPLWDAVDQVAGKEFFIDNLLV